MENTSYRAIAIVGTGAVLPDAVNVPAFWDNVKNGRYSISEVKPDRWDPALYYDADPAAPDRTYSTIGGWVRDFAWDPIKWHLPVPPRVVDAMDESQKWAIACTREALEDYGYPKRPLNTDRTAVILGNAMAGEKHYFTALRLYFPEYAHRSEEWRGKNIISPRCACTFRSTHMNWPNVRDSPICRKHFVATSLANCTTGWLSASPM